MKLFVTSNDTSSHVVPLMQDNRGRFLPELCLCRKWESRLRSAVPLDVAVADAQSHVDPSEGRRR